ncbi:hypothetical protein IAD21_04353 [Abditibacteriota bacterium]|nr:hypothetical protein IAD21_04353 [Abditibacteriota bacterium]
MVLFGLLFLAGCASQGGGFSPASDTSTASDSPASAPASNEGASGGSAGKAAGAPTGATAQLIQAASTVPRKIIYNATVDLIADNFPVAQRGLVSLIQKHRGYISETNIGGTTGTPREGTWKVRIPTDQFEGFMNAVVKLGELQTTHTDSQDVTAEFYDLQARISNKQVEEQRLQVHLQRSTAKLSDILQVEREISRVRGEIEEMQGRVRLLANLSSLSTITITLHEVKGYVPPKPTTFGSQIARSFETSLTALLDLGKAIVLIVVALSPWLVLLALIGFPLWRLARRFTPKP